MNLKNYLESLLGKQRAQEVLEAKAQGRPILVCGEQGPTGKSTLCRVLNRMGATALEQHDLCVVRLDEPLKELTPHMDELISE